MIEEAGGIVKYCQICGERMVIPDYYAAMRTMYCRPCAAEMHRMQMAAVMAKRRAEAKERRQLERQIAVQTGKENELLREAVRLQAARIEALERMIGGDDE